MQYKKLIPILKNKTYILAWPSESIVTFNIDLYIALTQEIQSDIYINENLNLEITRLRSYDGG